MNKPKSPCQPGKEFLHLSKDEVVFGEVFGWSDLGLTRGRILLAGSVVEGRVTPDSLMGRDWLHGEFLIRQTSEGIHIVLGQGLGWHKKGLEKGF